VRRKNIRIEIVHSREINEEVKKSDKRNQSRSRNKKREEVKKKDVLNHSHHQIRVPLLPLIGHDQGKKILRRREKIEKKKRKIELLLTFPSSCLKLHPLFLPIL
jgi:hypothetical protein